MITERARGRGPMISRSSATVLILCWYLGPIAVPGLAEAVRAARRPGGRRRRRGAPVLDGLEPEGAVLLGSHRSIAVWIVLTL